MKILLLTEVFPPNKGGSGRWLSELYRRLYDVETYVVAGHAPGAAAYDRTSDLPTERIALRFANWGIWNVSSGLQYARGIFDLWRAVKRVRPDAIHCGKCLPEGLLALVLKRWSRIPYCCFVHGEELTLAGTSKELSGLTRKVLLNASRVIANSAHTMRILVDEWQVPRDLVVVLHPGVDTTRFVPAPVNPATRARLGWSNRRVVLTVGALQKRKGQDMLIRALPTIRVRCPNVLYSVVGEGWERRYLEGLVAECGVTDLVQFRSIPSDDELIECYQQCDLFALPNRRVGWDFEGFGIVLLEAQACGKAVIAGASGGTSEAIVPSRTGELVACDTPEQLALVVGNLLEDCERAARMGERGREWVVERFDWQILAQQAGRLLAEDSSGSVTAPSGSLR